jgi:hypothetical protein
MQDVQIGSIEAAATSGSYTDATSALLDVDAGGQYAQLVAKASGVGASLGLRLRAIVAGVLTTLLSFAPGSTTAAFAGGVTATSVTVTTAANTGFVAVGDQAGYFVRNGATTTVGGFGSVRFWNGTGAGSTTDLAIGAVTSVNFFTNNSTTAVGILTSGGVFAWGTTVTTGANAGDMVMDNAGALRALNGARTLACKLVSIDSGNIVHLGDSGNGVPAAITLNTSTVAVGSSTLKGAMWAATDLAGTLDLFRRVTGARYKFVGTAF